MKQSRRITASAAVTPGFPMAGLTLAGKGAAPIPLRGPSVDISPALVETFWAMECDVRFHLVAPDLEACTAVHVARTVFEVVEEACTRLDPASPIMLANADPDEWHAVPAELFDALVEAYFAHRLTGGRFDPRLLRTTVPAPPVGHAGPWEPEFDEARHAVRIGPEPVDLGCISHGLAVRWAAEQLADHADAFLVEAGGDWYLGGAGPDGTGWRIGVEDPFGGSDPVAVLELIDLGCATSSVRLRRRQSGGRADLDLIDPRTGAPGGPSLLAVTVVGPDPAVAEVWSKALLLAGADGIAALADDYAALWVDLDGQLSTTPELDELLIWRGDDVG